MLSDCVNNFDKYFMFLIRLYLFSLTIAMYEKAYFSVVSPTRILSHLWVFVNLLEEKSVSQRYVDIGKAILSYRVFDLMGKLQTSVDPCFFIVLTSNLLVTVTLDEIRLERRERRKKILEHSVRGFRSENGIYTFTHIQGSGSSQNSHGNAKRARHCCSQLRIHLLETDICYEREERILKGSWPSAAVIWFQLLHLNTELNHINYFC